MAQTFEAVVEELQSVNKSTNKLVKLSKENEKSSVTEGTGTILKDDLKEGFSDLIGTVTGPLKAFADSVPGLGTLGKISKNISTNAIKTFKENRKETKLDKKEHKETVLEQQETQETVEENVALQTPMAAALTEINENTRKMADSLAMQGDPDELTAGEVEKNREEARAQQKQTDVLKQVVENTEGLENLPDGKEEKKGGIFGGIIGMFSRFAASIAAIPAMISGVVAAISAFGAALAPLALPIIAVVAGIVAAIGFIKGFMEGFSEGGIFGGLKEGMMKLFDWFIALPLNILKDITVWALNALGMENLASALDAFPLVESLRKMFSFIVDLFIVPIGFIMDTIGGVISSIFGGFMKQFENLKNFFLLLIKKRRIFFVIKIIDCFLGLCAKKRGEIKASLISSKELSSLELENISKELSLSMESTIKFDYKVDKNLIGGLKLQLGSFMIDTSIKNKLKKYEQRMLEN